MANWFTKTVSKLDWWNKDENARQAAQFAAEEEEERKRRRLEAVRSNTSQTPQPGTVIAPFAPPVKAPTTPQIGSQSQFDFNNMLLKPLKAPTGTLDVIKAQPKLTPEQVAANKKKQELEELAAANLEESRKKVTQGESFWGRNFLNRKAIEERAVADARTKATQQFQDKYGWNADPAVLDFTGGTKQRQNIESERLKKDAESLQRFEDKLVKVGEVASYVPVTGTVLDWGLRASDDPAVGNLHKRIQLGMTQEEFDSLDQETKDKLDLLMNAGSAAGVLDFTGIGGIMKAGGKVAVKKAVLEMIQQHGLKTATKKTFVRGSKELVKRGSVPAVAGGTLAVGGQYYLGGEEAVDPLSALKTGLMVGGTSLLDPSQGTRNVVKNSAEAKLVKATKEVTGDTGPVLDQLDVDPTAPKVEVSPGVKSTNLPKVADEAAAAAEDAAKEAAQNANAGAVIPPTAAVAPGAQSTVSVPDPSNPIALAKAGSDPLQPAATDVPIANFNKAINAPLQKVESPELPAPAAGATPEGNTALLSDAARAREMAEAGFVPTPAPSVAAATEDALETAAEAAARQQVNTPRADVPIFSGTLDEVTAAKIDDVIARSEATPVAPGMQRVFQDSGRGAGTTDWVFDNVDSLAAYKNNTTGADDSFTFIDVPEGSLKPTPNGEHVFRLGGTTEPPVSGGPAPRTREQAALRISDEDLRAEAIEAFPEAQRLNIEETETSAKAAVNSLDDDQLVSAYTNTPRIDDAEEFFMAVNSIRRLEAIGTPEARTAITNALDGLTDFSARSGRNLRVTQVLFEDMPSAMKTDFLTKKLAKAGVDLPDEERAILDNLILKADEATGAVRGLEDEARALLDSGLIRDDMAPETRARITELTEAIGDANRLKESTSGNAWEFYSSKMPPTGAGKRFADVGRTLMLSSPAGRAFDILSTTATTADDLLTRGVSNLIGKKLNKLPGVKPGTFQDTISAPGRLVKGIKEGASRIRDQWRGQNQVEDFMAEARRMTRGDIPGGSGLRQKIRTLVEAPTNLTRGLRDEQLFREGMQEAKKLGLKGDAANAYADLRASVPTKQQLDSAVQTHMKANMLHENKISKFLNNVANSLDKGGDGWAAPFIRNQVAPFTSWVGGNMHRTLTDKNVLHNAYKIADFARKGDAQGVVDNVSKLLVNTGEAYAIGMLLTKAGILTNEDANGDSYGGVYIHIGDRYIPVAILGTASVPIIAGNAVQQAYDASENGESPMGAFGNALLANTLKNAGVQSVFGGENTLQSTISSLVDDRGNALDAVTGYVGDFTRQYIPALSSDVNALLDATNLNPTGEAAETKVKGEDGKTDVGATEVNKTLNKIPFVSQSLPRQEGVPAKDILDRVLKSTQETGEMAQEKQAKKSLQDMERDLKREKISTSIEDIDGLVKDGDYDRAVKGYEYQLAKAEADETTPESKKQAIRDKIEGALLNAEGIPTDNDAIQASVDDGAYGPAIEGKKFQLRQLEADKSTPKAKKETMQKEITRLEVTRDGGYDPSVISLYEKTSVSEWRAMGNPESDDYDPETFALLMQYDGDLTQAGVSGSTKSGDKFKFTGAGGRGGSGKGPRIATDIATIGFNPGGSVFSPLKAQGASTTGPQSAIPTLQKVRNYDRSKLKKISVSKGGRA